MLWMFFSAPLILFSEAQAVSSNCVDVSVGTPGGPAVLPPHCTGGAGDIKKCTGDKTGLVEEVLSQKGKNLILRPGREASQENDIRNNIHCNTVALIASLLTLGIKIQINSIKSDHGIDGGFHPKGQALDLGYYAPGQAKATPDGVKVYEFLYKNRHELNVHQIIWQYPPEVSGIDLNKRCVSQLPDAGANGELGAAVNCDAFYKGDINGHHNHIHTSVHTGA